MNLNGTISKIPIKKLWILFGVTVFLIVILVISSDFTDLVGLFFKVISFGAVPIIGWVLLRTIYAGDHITMMGIYRFYFKKKHTKYEVSPALFKKVSK